MNSLIFNTTASELKTSVYGRNNGSNSLELLQLDGSGNLLVSVGNTSLSVEIANQSLSVDITNPSLTVEISNTALSVDIANSSLTVEVSNTELNVLISGNSFEYSSDLANGTSGTVLSTDISLMRTATVFIDNTTGVAFTVSMMLSPNDTIYFPSPNHSNKLIDAGSITVMPVDVFANYVALVYDADAEVSFSAYINAQA